jgi:hypothetical protein
LPTTLALARLRRVADLMNNFIQVEIKRASGSTAKPEQRNFVIGISAESVAADLARGDDSLVRKHCGYMPPLPEYVEKHLVEIQQVVGMQVAFSRANELHPLQPRTLPAEMHFSFPSSAPQSSEPNTHVGDFPVWDVSQ